MAAAPKEVDLEEITPNNNRRNLIIMAAVGVGALVLGAGGGFVGASMLGGGGAEAAAEGEAPAEGAHGEAAPAAEGGHGEAAPAAAGGHGGGEATSAAKGSGHAVATLGDFTVNLRGSAGGRILRMEVQVEGDAELPTVVEERKAQLRDGVLTLASDYTYPDLEGIDGKTRLRDEMHGRLNALLGGNRIQRVYFTEFVVQ